LGKFVPARNWSKPESGYSLTGEPRWIFMTRSGPRLRVSRQFFTKEIWFWAEE